MNDCLSHRGPDAEGVYADGPALLAHRRLSILDLSEAGRQPMSNGDETVHIVFNGEIYNYKELRERVDQYRFTSDTDTEVLLHLYEEHGVDCLQYLRGMFAFAIWDERRGCLFLARDRLGQKPLFYKLEDETIWFGSTIKTILADDAVSAEPDISALREYLTYQYVPHPRTGFESIRQLAPAEYMIVDEEGAHRDTYWSLSYSNQFHASPSTLADRLRTELREATRLRMRSDVPVGVFLSGGIDSSVVTALMDEVSDDPVGTYSIGFDKEAYDELTFARKVAEQYDTDHHEYTVTPDSMDVLPKLIDHYEMPFGDPSALPTYYVSQVAADDITVVLTGDAGDENFAGYDRYTQDQVVSLARRAPRPIRKLGAGALRMLPERLRDQHHVHLARRTLELANGDPVEQYARFICHATENQLDQIWDGPETDELANLKTTFQQADGPTRLDQIMDVDVHTYLPDDLLVKVDRASMAHSLEVRSPFLDHEFVQFAARIPAKYKWRRGKKKWLLKRAFADVLPKPVIERKKQGFGVPVNEWFRDDLREFAHERVSRLGERDPFDANGLESVLEEHICEVEDHGYRIWDMVQLEGWFERFID